MLIERASARRDRLWTWMPWICVGILAAILGRESVTRPVVAVALICLLGLGLLVVDRNLRILVPLAALALAWGSSILPGVSIAFPVKFAILAAICATLLPRMLGARGDHLPVPVAFSVAFGGLMMLALLSYAWSVSPSDSVQRAVSMLLVYVAVMFAIPLWCKDRDDAIDLIVRMGLVIAALTAIGIALGVAGIVEGFRDYLRFNGLLDDANALGYFAAPILPALVIMAAREPTGGRRRLLFGAILVIVVGIALSGSRGGSLAAASGVIVGLLVSGATRQGRTARRVLVLSLVALVAAVVVFPALGIAGRTATSANGEGFFQLGTGSDRSVAWAEAVPLIGQEPLIGHGFGTTLALFPSVQSLTDQAQILGRTHNSYLEAGIDLGWTGALWLVLLVVSAIAAAWRVARVPGPDQALATMLLAGLVAGAVEGLFESGLLAAGGLIALPFWMVAALAHSLRVRQVRDRTLVVVGEAPADEAALAPG